MKYVHLLDVIVILIIILGILFIFMPKPGAPVKTYQEPTQSEVVPLNFSEGYMNDSNSWNTQ